MHFIGSEWFANQQKFTIPIKQQSKEELNKCVQVFYAFIRQKNGSDMDIDIDIDIDIDWCRYRYRYRCRYRYRYRDR